MNASAESKPVWVRRLPARLWLEHLAVLQDHLQGLALETARGFVQSSGHVSWISKGLSTRRTPTGSSSDPASSRRLAIQTLGVSGLLSTLRD